MLGCRCLALVVGVALAIANHVFLTIGTAILSARPMVQINLPYVHSERDLVQHGLPEFTLETTADKIMKTDKDRELWLLKLTDEQAADAKKFAFSSGLKLRTDRGTIVRWGAIAVTGMTAASLVSSS